MREDKSMENLASKERVLGQTPLPKLVEGPHKAYLRQSLLLQMQQEGRMIRNWRKTLAWAFVLVLAVIVTGWAAAEIYKVFIVREEVVQREEFTAPDGTKGALAYKEKVSIDAMSQEEADRKYAQIQQAIAEGKYRLVKEIIHDNGTKTFHYEVTLPNGEVEKLGQQWSIGFDPKSITMDLITDLIHQGKGELVEQIKTEDGHDRYIYLVHFPNGMIMRVPFGVKIE